MTDADIQKLLKLLKLTTSDNDHEALSAIRKANALMKAHNLTWDDLYRAAPTPVLGPDVDQSSVYQEIMREQQSSFDQQGRWAEAWRQAQYRSQK